MDRILSTINVVNPQKMEIYGCPLCDSMKQAKVVFEKDCVKKYSELLNSIKASVLVD